MFFGGCHGGRDLDLDLLNQMVGRRPCRWFGYTCVMFRSGPGLGIIRAFEGSEEGLWWSRGVGMNDRNIECRTVYSVVAHRSGVERVWLPETRGVMVTFNHSETKHKMQIQAEMLNF